MKNEFPAALVIVSLAKVAPKSKKSKLLLHRLFHISYAIRRVHLQNETKILGNNQKRHFSIREKSTGLTAGTFKAILEN